MKAREENIRNKLLLPRAGEEHQLIKQILIYNGYLHYILVMITYQSYPQEVEVAEEIWVRNARGPSFLHVDIRKDNTNSWSNKDAQEIYKVLSESRRLWENVREALIHQPLRFYF